MKVIQRVMPTLPVSEDQSSVQLDDPTVESTSSAFIVLRFNNKCSPDTISWLTKLISTPVAAGGSELLVTPRTNNSSEDGEVFYISSSHDRLLRAADKNKLKKQTKDGNLQQFTVEEKDNFEGFMNNENNFTSAEKQYLTMQCLKEICAEESVPVPGFSKAKLFKGRPIIPRCLSENVIAAMYPLHDVDQLVSLEKKWYMNYSKLVVPLREIREYFGETIALYFAFLGFYTKFLVPPCIIAVIHKLFISDEKEEENAWFAALNLIWATVFLEIWKRRCAEIAFNWGTLSKHEDESELIEPPRADFRGHPRISPITGLSEQYYPTWKRRVKIYCVSYPLLIISLKFAVIGMWIYFDLQQSIKKAYGDKSGIIAKIIKTIPSVMYASVIFLVNNLYSKIATKLNDWENHRLESSYKNHLIIKLVLFHSVNSFLSLFYIAFYLHDMKLLRQHLAALLITQQIIQQVQESLIPYLMFKRHGVKVKKEGRKILVKQEDAKDKITREEKLPTYPGTFYDYLEMYIQFGYVFMFSAAYPLAAFWALTNNIIEMRSDAFKLCRLFQRPFFETASSIGAWQAAFEIMSVVAVMTNCALLAMSHSTQKWLGDLSVTKYILLFVAVEHTIIIVKFLVAYLIPDVPGWITKRLARMEYENQIMLKTRKREQKNQSANES